MAILLQIFEICIIPLLGVLVGFLVKYIQAKSDKLIAEINNQTAKSYVEMITNTVTDCVIATNQTYTEALKKEGKFDAEAQKVAFDMTYQAVLKILSDDAIEYIKQITDDVEFYLTQRIEAAVKKNK